MKKIIGVVPACELYGMEKSSMYDRYLLGNNYVKRVTEAGCTPIGVGPVDAWVSEDVLDVCDGFVVQGGADFSPYHFQVIHHAYIHGKRYLGICLGEQLIYCYFYLRDLLKEHTADEDFVQQMWGLYKQIESVDSGTARPSNPLKPVDGHYEKGMTRGQEDEVKHDVTVVPGTILHRLLGRESFRGASYHHVRVPSDQTLLTINAWAADGSGVVEGVEYGENILGVQCHPEVDGLLPEIFSFLAET